MSALPGPPLFFWVMLAVTVAAFAWAIVAMFRRRAIQAVVGTSIGALVGFAIWYFAINGGFCVPPPGSACL